MGFVRCADYRCVRAMRGRNEGGDRGVVGGLEGGSGLRAVRSGVDECGE